MLDQIAHLVAQMPDHWATAPIYRKGVTLPSGSTACGKSPLGRASKVEMAPQASLIYLEKYPDTYGAIGVYTGPRSKGLVILDVDANLGAVQMKWGADLDTAPCVRSPKQNAAKYLFQVPQELWDSVADISLAASKEGWEVLWGRQGLLGGVYHSGGEYTLEGDLSAVPEAPAWLIARMQERKQEREARNTTNKAVNDRYRYRTKEERLAIVTSCLSVIPNQGAGSYDFWFELGAMVHSADLGDDGLNAWREWSKGDEEYAEYWDKGDRCAEKWQDYTFREGGLSLGSLVRLADTYDPERKRFQGNDLASVVETAETAAQRIRFERPSHEEIVSRAEEAMKQKNPSLVQHLLHEIALDAGYRDASAVVRLLIGDQEFKRGSQGGSLAEILAAEEEPINYLIPELLPRPGTLLIHGRGGSGKTMAMLTLAKHVARGTPFSVRGMEVPVEQGTVLWLNGDQNSRRIRAQFEDLDFLPSDPVIVENKCSMLWYPWFINLVEEYKPKLVVWDSVTACMRGCAFDQNKAEYAEPLYWYSAENGESFPETTIAFIHHQGKQGTFRGTSALEDAVDESWGLAEPKEDEKAKFKNSRIITVGKSREGNNGKVLLLTQTDDLTFQLKDMPQKNDGGMDMASSISERVLKNLVDADAWLTRVQAFDVPGGTVEAKKKCLARWVKKGLVLQQGSGRTALYRAVSTHARAGVGGSGVPISLDRSHTNGSGPGQPPKVSRKCPESVPVSAGDVPIDPAGAEIGTLPRKSGQKRDRIGTLLEIEPSADEAFEETGHETAPTFTRAEIRELEDAAWNACDLGDLTAPAPMDKWETLKTISDFDNCVDVPAEEV